MTGDTSMSVTSERGPRGQWIVSAIVRGYLVVKQYYYYTRREAIELFIAEYKDGIR